MTHTYNWVTMLYSREHCKSIVIILKIHKQTKKEVPSLSSRLRIPCCCSCGTDCNCRAGWIPSPITFMCCLFSRKKKKKANRRLSRSAWSNHMSPLKQTWKKEKLDLKHKKRFVMLLLAWRWMGIHDNIRGLWKLKVVPADSKQGLEPSFSQPQGI